MAFNFLVDQAINTLKKVDFNKNGIKDIDEVKSLIDKASPCLKEAAEHIEWSKVIAFVAEKFAKNPIKATEALKQLGEVLKALQKLLPAEGK